MHLIDLRAMQKRIIGVEIDIRRFEYQDYADNSFDFLILFNVIENVPNLDVFMQNISRVVSLEGILY